jgi:dihydrofolate reductase
MLISIVVAASANNVIGRDNRLLWHLPNDLKFFKNITWAMPVVMGRKTFESLGYKPLPGRLNIVITHKENWTADGVIVAHSLDEAVCLAESHQYKELFIAGGGEIYREAILCADKIYLTRVNVLAEGDSFFPEIDPAKWQMVSTEDWEKDEKHVYSYSFQLWKRK